MLIDCKCGVGNLCTIILYIIIFKFSWDITMEKGERKEKIWNVIKDEVENR
ncbi:hypothetical protein L21TH_2561 [Caldisalinibacter kiritimatiensis]|uniref:Uncharacterized protein n=1 Tax=Caldisalinibacter kiritimatiensis TaxID=1304284 RepID=R1CL20_9FIRM|nr:hypothetical protein L21TH_2561 [Caldisalinibacter kiritimatiensis]